MDRKVFLTQLRSAMRQQGGQLTLPTLHCQDREDIEITAGTLGSTLSLLT